MVTDLRLNLDLDFGNDNDKKAETKLKIKEAEKRKKQATETIDEAWLRVMTMKNSDKDLERLQEVKQAMLDGKVERSPSDIGKRFSKAEALRLHRELVEKKREFILRDMVEKKPENYILVSNEMALNHLIEVLKTSELVAFDIETFSDEKAEYALDHYRGKVAGFSVSNDKWNFYLPLNHKEQTELTVDAVIQPMTVFKIMDRLKPFLEGVKTVMHNAPFDCKWFKHHFDIDMITNLFADTRILAFCLDENRSHRLKDLASDWLGIESDNFDELFGSKVNFSEIELAVANVYACKDTALTLKLFRWIMNWLNKENEDMKRLKKIAFEIEMPVLREFIRADLRGIKFDVERAKQLDNQYAAEEASLVKQIYTLFGKEINLNSPSQMAEVLYKELKLSNPDKGSTGVKTLKKIKKEHPSIPLILEYRELSKLRTAFTQKLPEEVREDGKIHPSFNTLGAATARKTCNSPNLQQVPSKRPEIRKLFVANEGRILVSIDYSQIELRVLAHLANEKNLINAFMRGQDIHSTTAAMISDGQFTYEDIEQLKDIEGHAAGKFRKQAKIVNFGIVYGMSAKGLAETLQITTAEAEILIENYFKGYPGIKNFMDTQKEFVTKNGFVYDGMFGRKRRLQEEVKSGDKYKLFSAQRMAGNFPIQSSAGTMLKVAEAALVDVLKPMNGYIALSIHDEVVFDLPADISYENLMKIKETMENAVKLVVPVRCDVEISPERWSDNVSIAEYFGLEVA